MVLPVMTTRRPLSPFPPSSSPSSSPSNCNSTSAAFALASSLSFPASSLLLHSGTLLLQNLLSLHDSSTTAFSWVSSSLAGILQKYSPSLYDTLTPKKKLALIIAKRSIFNLDLFNLLELLLLHPPSSLQSSQLSACISKSDAFYLTSLRPPLYLSFFDILCRISSPRKCLDQLGESPILLILEAWNDCFVNLVVQGRESVANDIVEHLPPHVGNLLRLLLCSPPTMTDSRGHIRGSSPFRELNAARNRILEGSAWTEVDIESNDPEALEASMVPTRDDEASVRFARNTVETEGLWMMMFGFANWRKYATEMASGESPDPEAIEYLAWLRHPDDGHARVFYL